MREIGHFVGGKEVKGLSGRFGDIFDPNTGEVQAKVALAKHSEVEHAIANAEAAHPGWASTNPQRRARVMFKFLELIQAEYDDLARLLSSEHGKTFADSKGDIQRGLEVVEFACGIPHLMKGEFSEGAGPGIDLYSMRQPLGVCAGVTPFNFPVMVPLWMFPVALACGNTFVLKPSEKVPSASMRMAELLKQAGLPDGVFNVVHGDKEAVDALLNHPDIKAISFVGSTPIAKYLYETAAKNGKRVQALGGAKNHAVVLPDMAANATDLEFAADALIGAAYGSAGERCMAISAVVAVGEAGDPLVAKLKDKAAKLNIGPGDGKDMDMGPLVTRAHRNKVASYIDRGVAEGAKLMLDGRGFKVTEYQDGFFLGASLFDHVKTDMTIYKDEIFGPVLVVLRAKTLDDAIRMINSNPYANGTAVFTRSGGAARKFEREVDVGMVGINVPIPVPVAFFSFGGWRNSLFGDQHVHGMEGVRFYTRGKVVTTRWPATDTAVAGFNMPTLG